MNTIKLAIEPDDLKIPGVAEALAQLIIALGGSTGSVARTTRPARRRAAPPVGEVTYEAFYANLPDRTQKFLDLIKERGTLTQRQAMKELGLSQGKALGGIVGSLRRSAERQGVDLGFTAEKTKKSGRVWRKA